MFRALSEVYLAGSRGDDTVEQTLSAVAHFFPTEQSSGRLKAEYFGVDGRYSSTIDGEAAVLSALTLHPAGQCVSDSVASLEQRSADLVGKDIRAATRIALSATSVGGSRAQRFLNGFAIAIEAGGRGVQELPLALLFELLDRRPMLVASASVWERSAEQQVAIVGHLSSSVETEPQLRTAAVRAVIDAAAWPALSAMLAQFGGDGLAAVLAWVDEGVSDAIWVPEEVQAALEENRPEIIEMLLAGALGARSLKVLTTMLDPRSEAVQRFGTAPWLEIARSGIRLRDRGKEIRSKSFMLALGMALREKRAAVLLGCAFSEIYEAAAAGRSEDAVWEYVEPYLPWYAPSWDRCARLTQSVVRRFVRRSLSLTQFIRAFDTQEQLARALGEAAKGWEGRRYIRRLCRRKSHGRLVMRTDQAATLEGFCREVG